MSETPIEEGQEDVQDQTVDEPMAEEAVGEGADEASEEPAEEAATGTRLVLKRSGQETDIVFSFSAPATIGRFDPSVGPVDIDLGQIEEGSYVSRKHARIEASDDGYKIVDLGSSNGTYVLREDFEKVDEAELNDGDEISLGNARFVFHV